MSVRRLELLIRLIRTLSYTEFANLIDYLSAFHSKQKDYIPKTALLAEAIKNRTGDCFHSDLKKQISDESSNATFDQLIHRLYIKTLESVVLQVNTSNPKLYSDLWQTKFDLRRKLSAIDILFGKNLYANARKLLDLVLAKAKNFEVYDVYIEALTIHISDCVHKADENRIAAMRTELTHTQRINDAILDARVFFAADMANEAWKLHGKNTGVVEQKLVELDTLLKELNSVNLRLWRSKIALNYYESLNDAHKSYELALEQLKLVQENKCLRSRQRVGAASIHVAHNLMLLHKFKQAIPFAKKCLESYGENSATTGQLAIEYIFQAHFHSGNFVEAFKLINQLITKPLNDTPSITVAKHHYYRACIHFIRGHYNKCLADLAKTYPLQKDKEGWNLNIRILQIMAFLDNDNHDQADSAITNLYKGMNFIEKTEPIRLRYTLIYNTFKTLQRSAFKFKEVELALRPVIEQLQGNDPEIRIELLKPEFIAVDKWLKAKLGDEVDGGVVVSFAA